MDTASRLKLYSYPVSNFSQKVRFSLYAKGVDFDIVNVDVFNEEGLEPWYMALNPTGFVPTLDDNGKILLESDVIIDYIDKKFPQEPCLVPDIKTPSGTEVTKWRRKLDTILWREFTMGTWMNPHLSTTGLKLKVPLTLESLRTKNKESVPALEQRAKDNPKLYEAYHKRLEGVKQLLEVMDERFSAASIKKALDNLEEIFDAAEQQLKKTQERCKTDEFFLFGTSINTVDISMAVLFERLNILGYESNFIGKNKRRLVYLYWERLRKQSFFQKFKAEK